MREEEGLKRFLLFTGSQYYARGGWSDFKSSFDTFEEALKEAANTNCDWWHIVNSTTRSVVDCGYRED
jgi:hypothetical protein